MIKKTKLHYSKMKIKHPPPPPKNSIVRVHCEGTKSFWQVKHLTVLGISFVLHVLSYHWLQIQNWTVTESLKANFICSKYSGETIMWTV